MQIMKARPEETDLVIGIYRDAAKFMSRAGNPDQWKDGYPTRELIEDDIRRGFLYTVKDEGLTVAVFYSRFGEDETYKNIYGGQWHTKSPYGIIHRIAVAEDCHGRGIVGFCFGEVKGWWGSIRIDTHKDNLPMQRALEKFGFRPCGIIHLANGEERIAYDIGE